MMQWRHKPRIAVRTAQSPCRHFRCITAAVVLSAFATNSTLAQTEQQPVQSPREMLQVMQIDESQLRFFVDDQPMEEETEALQRLLFRMNSFAQVHVDRWSRPISELPMMLADPDSYRFELYDIHGQIVDLKPIQIIPEMAIRVGFREYYQLLVQHDDTQSIVFVRTIPRRWLNSLEQHDEIREHARIQGLLLKRAVLGDKRALVFAANRVNWQPNTTSAALGVSADQVLLGQLGVDIDRLSEVVQRAPMVGMDRECLFQMLAAVRLAEPEQLAKLGRREFDMARLIQTPELASGELYTLEGLARRAIKIRIDPTKDADIQERFGIDHYYEIEVFITLQTPVRFVDTNDPEDQVGKVFTDYPFVACVPELPEGMEQGDDIRVPLQFSGFFMKLWAYHTEFMSGDRERAAQPRLQQSPLFIGPTVTLSNAYEPQDSSLSLIIATLFTATLLVLWLVLWRASVKDNLSTQKLFRKHEPSNGSFERLRDLER